LCIEEAAFFHCSSLPSISIPAAVETLCRRCFAQCLSLSTVIFESGSNLSGAEGAVFEDCTSLSSIWIPVSLEGILSRYQHLLKLKLMPGGGQRGEQ
jgi:hypothetical protein